MKKKDAIISLSCIVSGFIMAIILGLIIRKQNNDIKRDGIYTVGTVFSSSSQRGRAPMSSIYFYFEYNGRIIRGVNINDKYYGAEVVGMKYVVKFVPEKITDKIYTNYAKIYINVPMPMEYQDIEKEREKIKQIFGEQVLKKADKNKE